MKSHSYQKVIAFIGLYGRQNILPLLQVVFLIMCRCSVITTYTLKHLLNNLSVSNSI